MNVRKGKGHAPRSSSAFSAFLFWLTLSSDGLCACTGADVDGADDDAASDAVPDADDDAASDAAPDADDDAGDEWVLPIRAYA